MNKQEAIKRINDLWSFILEDGPFEVDLIIKTQVLDIVSQIHEPQKVTIPKFVAEWIDKHKNGKKKYRLSHALENVFDDTELGLYIKQREGDYTETIAKAWLDYPNIIIEKEKLYTVEIPNPNNEYSMNVLIRLPSSGKISLVALHKPNTSYLKNKEYQLTESEIKEDFEWAWDAGLAKEVEDDTD